jgi:hypothetical protein
MSYYNGQPQFWFRFWISYMGFGFSYGYPYYHYGLSGDYAVLSLLRIRISLWTPTDIPTGMDTMDIMTDITAI